MVVVADAAPARAAMKVERVVSPGGIEAWLMRDPSIPVLAMEIVFRGGSAHDPADKTGLANLTASLLDEGAGELDSEAFQERMADLALDFSARARVDQFAISVRSATVARRESFELVRLALTEPRFDEEAIERMKRQVLSSIRRRELDSSELASRNWYAQAFPGHPYGRDYRGSADSVAGIARADLQGFMRNVVTRDNLVIGVMGDIAPDELGRLLDSTFGDLPPIGARASIAETEVANLGRVFVVPRPGPQTQILIGDGGIKRSDPDWYAAFVMNHILGGGSFTSRLFDEVREKRGLAYSVYSYLAPLDRSAVMAAGAATANETAGEALDIIRKEWRRLAEETVSDETLRDAKTFLTGSFPLQFVSSGRVAATLAAMQTESLGIEYLDRRNSYIEAVTAADIKRVAQRLLRADSLLVVMVGEPKGVAGEPIP